MKVGRELQSAIRNPQSAIYYWLPAIIWMATIFSFSTDYFSADQTGSRLWPLLHWLIPRLTFEQYQLIHYFIRKAAHFTEYALLALLLWRAFRAGAAERWRWRWGINAAVATALYALLDEWHQSFTLHRTASLYDSLIDTAGGWTALAVLWLLSCRVRRK